MLPWWSKIGAKLLLSKLPVTYSCWSTKFGIFRHGKMDSANYALGVYSRHFDYCQPRRGFTCLELGPGDGLSSALLTKAFGGARSYLIDVGDFATQDMELYRSLAERANESGRRAPDLAEVPNAEEMLVLCNSSYLTDGLASLKSLPSGAIDFAFSQSCLEHVRLNLFEETVRELRRVMSPNGCASHRVDLMDHLDHDLNNLRFPDDVWESNLMASSGFYTNRIRYGEMLEMFRRAGFAVEVTERYPFPKPRIPRSRLSPRFQSIEDDDLDVAAFTMRCRPVRSYAVA